LREVRWRLGTLLYSKLSDVDRAYYRPLLDALYEQHPADVRPHGGWDVAGQDTILIVLDGRLLGAVCVRNVAVIDPLLIDQSLEGLLKTTVFDFAVRRAEGVLQASIPAESYFFGVSPNVMAAFCDWLAGQEGSEEWSTNEVRFFRRKL
jgi:hypothetical protein